MIRHITFAIVISSLIVILPAVAQDQKKGRVAFNFDGAGVHQSETDLSDGGGDFSVDGWFVRLGMDYGWTERDSIGISVGTGESTYEFGDFTGFGGGDPWDSVEESRVSVTWRFGFGEKGSFILVPTARFNSEKDAGSGDSSTYGVYAAAVWQVNPDLAIGPGIGVFSRLENDTRFFPILAIEWDINDRWFLSTGRGLAATQGPGLTLGYKLNEDWSLGLAGRYEDVEFRLDKEGPAAGGVGRDQSFPLVFFGTLEPNKTLKLSVFAGIELNGTLKLKNSTGDTVDKSSYDPAPVFGAVFNVRF